jgi:hypothetical protein
MTTNEKTTLKQLSEELKESINLRQNLELIDDCFYVEEKKWGTWDSKDGEGKKLVTSMTRDNCIAATRFYLKGLQEGFDVPVKSHDGVVDGKL